MVDIRADGAVVKLRAMALEAGWERAVPHDEYRPA
jgi:hypothetical protein